MTLKRTTDTLPRKRYGTVEFAQGDDETDEYDSETEEWAAETFDELEVSGADTEGNTVEDEAARVVSEMEAEEDEVE